MKKTNESFFLIISSLFFAFFCIFISNLIILVYIKKEYTIYDLHIEFIALFFILAAVFFIVFLRSQSNQKLVSKQLHDLSIEYNELIKLVNDTASEHLKELKEDDESFDFFSIKRSSDWLIAFEKNLNYILENRIIGKIDTFTYAASLIDAISEEPLIVFDEDSIEKETKPIYDALFLLVNTEIAFKVAFKMISKPSNYIEVSKGSWVKVYCDEVNIYVPDGVIERSPLCDRIINTYCKDYTLKSSFSIMQLANMLHLLYLYCKDCKND